MSTAMNIPTRRRRRGRPSSSRPNRASVLRHGGRRLGLEPLEDRRLLSADLLMAAAIAGNSASFEPVLSADGRHVAFTSAATNLVPGDTNGWNDVFVKDLQTGAINLVSAGTTGTQANGPSRAPGISADGRYVAFQSEATNLIFGDSNGLCDVFVKDLQTGAITRASTNGAGVQGDRASYEASLSGEGRYVAFSSDARNLVPGDINNSTDVFVKDLQSGAIVRASTDGSGREGNDNSTGAAIAGGGRYLAFSSDADNLVPGDTNESTDAFVKDLQTGAIIRASTDRSGNQADASSYQPAISGDGRYAAFLSYADNLVPADTNAHNDVFVKDLQSGAILRTSTDRNGNQANGNTSGVALSADGRFVAFTSAAANLVPLDTNGTDDVFVKDLRTGVITRADTDGQGRQASGTLWPMGTPSLSGDGRYVAFASDAANLVPGDVNGSPDVFVKDLQTGGITLASSTGGVAPDSTPGLYDPATSVWQLKNSFVSGVADTAFGFGAPGAGWLPVAGDWNGDGVETVGLYDPASSLFYLRNSNTTGMADLVVGFGAPGGGWIPLAGDWNGDGIDTAGLYDPASSRFYLRNANTSGVADLMVPFGAPGAGWLPVAGDWNADGRDSLGLYDGAASIWYLTDSLSSPWANHAFGFGQPGAGWIPVAGDWNADGTDTAGLYDPSTGVWYLINDHSPASPITVGFGAPGAGWLPVVGDWDGQAGSPVMLDPQAVDQIELSSVLDGEIAGL